MAILEASLADAAAAAAGTMPMEAGVGDCLGLLVIIADVGFNRSEPKFEPENDEFEPLPESRI